MVVFSGFGQQKTKPNKANVMVHSCSFLVLRKDKERLFEKTNPILWRANLHKLSNSNGLWRFERIMTVRKQSQFAGFRPEIRNTKLEIPKQTEWILKAHGKPAPVLLDLGMVLRLFARKICKKQASLACHGCFKSVWLRIVIV